MLEEFVYLKERFNIIKSMGYIKCNYTDFGGPGRMLEKLLINKSADSSRLPDFFNTEIKAIYQYSKYAITLFSLLPSINNYSSAEIIGQFLTFYYYKESNWIPLEKSVANSLPHFYLQITNDFNQYLNGILKFKLDFNDENRIIIFNFYNLKTGIKDNSIYWKYDDIINAFNKKMKNLAIIKYERYLSNKILYCKYNSIEFYKNFNDNLIIDMLKDGKVTISFNIDSKVDLNNNLLPYYHGVRFEIKLKSLKYLYHECIIF